MSSLLAEADTWSRSDIVSDENQTPPDLKVVEVALDDNPATSPNKAFRKKLGSDRFAYLGARGLFTYFTEGNMDQPEPVPRVEDIDAALMIYSFTASPTPAGYRDPRGAHLQKVKPKAGSLWYPIPEPRFIKKPNPSVLVSDSKSRFDHEQQNDELRDTKGVLAQTMKKVPEGLDIASLETLSDNSLEIAKKPAFRDGKPIRIHLGGVILSHTDDEARISGVVLSLPMIQATEWALGNLTYWNEPKAFQKLLRTREDKTGLAHIIAGRALAKPISTAKIDGNSRSHAPA